LGQTGVAEVPDARCGVRPDLVGLVLADRDELEHRAAALGSNPEDPMPDADGFRCHFHVESRSGQPARTTLATASTWLTLSKSLPSTTLKAPDERYTYTAEAGVVAELLGHWLASSPAPQALREQPHLR
jgi:hypothetical protein